MWEHVKCSEVSVVCENTEGNREAHDLWRILSTIEFYSLYNGQPRVSEEESYMIWLLLGTEFWGQLKKTCKGKSGSMQLYYLVLTSITDSWISNESLEAVRFWLLTSFSLEENTLGEGVRFAQGGTLSDTEMLQEAWSLPSIPGAANTLFFPWKKEAMWCQDLLIMTVCLPLSYLFSF